MQARDPAVYLRHIRDCCLEIAKCEGFVKVGEIHESIVFAAVCRNLEIIGEAANKIDADFRAANPEIPWRQMISVRNILIHNYDGIEHQIVWAIVGREIPALLAAVNNLLR